MADVLAITGPIFILIGIGFLAVRAGVIAAETLPGMGRFVLHYCLPALIFSTVSGMDFETLIEPAYLTVYGAASLLMLLGGVAFVSMIQRQSLSTSGVMGLGMSLSNSAFIGYPVLLQVFGEPPAQAFAMSLMVENIIVMPIALMIIEYGNREKGAAVSLTHQLLSVLQRLVRSPLLLAIGAGMLVSLLEFPVPATINKSLDMLAQASVAVALFTIGGTLVGNPIKGDLESIGTVLTGKLIIHPILVFLLLMLAPTLDEELKLSMLILAAMPMLSVFPIIGSNYGAGKLCASILLLTTVTSFISITALLTFAT
ncbi:MAG: transporter [Halomonas sp.]|nr:transporter [Halomonas sp.]